MQREYEKQKFINSKTFFDLLNHYTLIGTNIFNYGNLDDLCGFGAENFLKNELYFYGVTAIVNRPEVGPVVVHVTNNNNQCFNSYKYFTHIDYQFNGHTYTESIDNVGIIENNNLRLGTFEIIYNIIYNVYETISAINVNIKAQKTPVLLQCDRSSLLTLKNLYQKYSGNMPVIYGKKDLDLQNAITSVNTSAPFVADKLFEIYEKQNNIIMQRMGIDYVAEKKERLISDEVEKQSEGNNYFLKSFLYTQKKDIKRVNELFFKNSEKKIKFETNGLDQDENDTIKLFKKLLNDENGPDNEDPEDGENE